MLCHCNDQGCQVEGMPSFDAPSCETLQLLRSNTLLPVLYVTRNNVQCLQCSECLEYDADQFRLY